MASSDITDVPSLPPAPKQPMSDLERINFLRHCGYDIVSMLREEDTILCRLNQTVGMDGSHVIGSNVVAAEIHPSPVGPSPAAFVSADSRVTAEGFAAGAGSGAFAEGAGGRGRSSGNGGGEQEKEEEDPSHPERSHAAADRGAEPSGEAERMRTARRDGTRRNLSRSDYETETRWRGSRSPQSESQKEKRMIGEESPREHDSGDEQQEEAEGEFEEIGESDYEDHDKDEEDEVGRGVAPRDRSAQSSVMHVPVETGSVDLVALMRRISEQLPSQAPDQPGPAMSSFTRVTPQSRRIRSRQLEEAIQQCVRAASDASGGDRPRPQQRASVKRRRPEDDGATSTPATDATAAKRFRGGPPMGHFDPSVLRCALCTGLLLDPVMVPCGDRFCRSCAFRMVLRSHQCAVCRATLVPKGACVVDARGKSWMQADVDARRAQQTPPFIGRAAMRLRADALLVPDKLVRRVVDQIVPLAQRAVATSWETRKNSHRERADVFGFALSTDPPKRPAVPLVQLTQHPVTATTTSGQNDPDIAARRLLVRLLVAEANRPGANRPRASQSEEQRPVPTRPGASPRVPEERENSEDRRGRESEAEAARAQHVDGAGRDTAGASGGASLRQQGQQEQPLREPGPEPEEEPTRSSLDAASVAASYPATLESVPLSQEWCEDAGESSFGRTQTHTGLQAGAEEEDEEDSVQDEGDTDYGEDDMGDDDAEEDDPLLRERDGLPRYRPA